MSEGVVVTNPLGFFTYYNQAALDIIGSHTNWLYNNVNNKEDFKIKGHYYFYEREKQIKLRTKSKKLSEIVAYNYQSPEGTLNGWKNSKDHNKVLNNPNLSYIVIASKDKFTAAILYN
jgi:hypothetical protein